MKTGGSLFRIVALFVLLLGLNAWASNVQAAEEEPESIWSPDRFEGLDPAMVRAVDEAIALFSRRLSRMVVNGSMTFSRTVSSLTRWSC